MVFNYECLLSKFVSTLAVMQTLFVTGRRPTDNEYKKHLQAVQGRLSTMTDACDPNSVLNSLRFFTRHEELDEYFCVNCNQGDLFAFVDRHELISSMYNFWLRIWDITWRVIYFKITTTRRVDDDGNLLAKLSAVGQTNPRVTRGSKQTTIFNPPAILVIHLKRFEQVTQYNYIPFL